ncbi:MAG: hypothetical protein M3O50_07665 [Myxococcota bacterium]|nr:hypothetical protein [Myxococcota bacterium]
MDCETFESALTSGSDAELERVTSEAGRRHLADCARCASLLERGRRMRDVALFPRDASDAGASLVGAAKGSDERVLLRQRTARMISLAGSWAMRPQSAMVAVFFVMLASSVLLLRGKSARAPASAEVIVTERGTPAPAASATSAPITSDPRSGAIKDRIPASAEARQPGTGGGEGGPHPAAARNGAPVALRDVGAVPFRGPALSMPAASSTADGSQASDYRNMATVGFETVAQQRNQDGGAASPFDDALAAYRAGRYEDAARAFEALVPLDTTAELWAARSIREGRGCRASVGRFDRLAQEARQTSPGWDALLEGALCYRALNELGNARTRLNALLAVDSHKDRAIAEIDRLDQMQRAGASHALPTKGTAKNHSSGPEAAGR